MLQEKNSSVRSLLLNLQRKQKQQIKYKKSLPKLIQIQDIEKSNPPWKGSGYCNIQFEKIKLVKSKMLSTWEIGRIGLAGRSWNTPKDFKGIKCGLTKRQFSVPRYSLPLKDEQKILKKPLEQKNNFINPWQSKKSFNFQRSSNTMFGYKTQSFKNLKIPKNNFY